MPNLLPADKRSYPAKLCHHLDMVAHPELVNHLHPVTAIAALAQRRRIAARARAATPRLFLEQARLLMTHISHLINKQ